MRVVIQRVSSAQVVVDDVVVGAIDQGYVLLVGVTHNDSTHQADWMARKIAGLRLFEDDQGLTNLSLAEVDGEILAISQFTLYADTRRGRRPSFVNAAPPHLAEPIIEHFVTALRRQNIPVATGRFGASMQVSLTNDGPVTIILERD